MQRSSKGKFLGVFAIVGFLVFLPSLISLVRFSWNQPLYSHIVLIPFISGYFVLSRKRELPLDNGLFFASGIGILLVSLALLIFGNLYGGLLNSYNTLIIQTLAMVLWWIGTFYLLYGPKGFGIVSFPFFFLLFMVPVPKMILDRIISMLQVFTCETAYFIFKLLGIDISRSGFLFHLTGLDIEVARACSGIRSFLVLFILSILIGYLFLKRYRNRVILVFSVLPIAVFKNALRIVAISLLSVYVDRGFLEGSLHTRGGIPFFILALAMMAPMVWLLRKYEGHVNE